MLSPIFVPDCTGKLAWDNRGSPEPFMNILFQITALPLWWLFSIGYLVNISFLFMVKNLALKRYFEVAGKESEGGHRRVAIANILLMGFECTLFI